MMDHADHLRSLSRIPQAVWLLFLGAYKPHKLDLYLFVEGQDDLSFYSHIIRQAWRSYGLTFAYNCKGKDNVIGVMPRIKATLDQEWRGLFFIDKDVDDLCGITYQKDKYLFETTCYSIENLLVDAEAIVIVWTDLLKLSASDARLARILTAFDEATRLFVANMRSVMGWVIYLRRNGHKVILNDVSMDNVLELDDECRSVLRGDWRTHIAAASNTHGASWSEDDVNAVACELAPLDCKGYIRGKFDLWFFINFLRKVVLASAATHVSDEQPRGKMRITITDKNAIDVLSPRLATHPSITNFLACVLPTSTR